MSSEFKIQYDEVVLKSAILRMRLELGLIEMDAEYAMIQSKLTEVDGATNAFFAAAMERNRQKAMITGETLRKLLAFLHNATKKVEQEERDITAIFRPGVGIGNGSSGGLL